MKDIELLGVITAKPNISDLVVTLLLIGAAFVVAGVIGSYVVDEWQPLIVTAVGAFIVIATMIHLYSVALPSAIEETQTSALEEKFGYTKVSVEDGSFIASDDGAHVAGDLVEYGDHEYLVITTND